MYQNLLNKFLSFNFIIAMFHTGDNDIHFHVNECCLLENMEVMLKYNFKEKTKNVRIFSK